MIESIGWTRTDHSICVTCKSKFFHDKWRETIPKKEILLSPPLDEAISSTSFINIPVPEETPRVVRSSSRKRNSYETNRNVEEEKKCIICNSVKKDKKGRIVPVTIITLKDKGNPEHLAEATLLRYA